MNTKIAVAALLATVAMTPLAMAARITGPSPADDIRVVVYSPIKRVEIIGVVGQPTTITFPLGESVYRVVQTGKPNPNGSIGDAGWQGASADELKSSPLGNNLTLWPAVAGDSTMTVITMTMKNEQKVYPFKLVAKAKDDGGDPIFNLIYRGGAVSAAPAATAAGDDPPPRVSRARARKQLTAAEEAAADEQLRTDSFNGPTPCHYVAKGKYPNGITPLCPMDNQQWTLMRFPGLSKKPSVYTEADGSDCGADDMKHERVARQHGAGDFIVVEEIAPRFCLRLGSEVLEIINTAWSPIGADPGTGTITPAVNRDIIKAKAP